MIIYGRLDEHFEEQEGLKSNYGDVFDCYIAMCVKENVKNAMEMNQVVKVCTLSRFTSCDVSPT